MAMKIVVAGPAGCGKSTISNFLAGSKDSLVSEKYSPTIGVRILEIELKVEGSNDINIELWDASGDTSFEGCWRAIMADSDGILLVYNPDAPAQDQQIMDWFEFFVRKNGLKDEQCVILAHRSNASGSNERFRPPPLFSRVTAALTTSQSGSDIKSMFENFARDIKSIKSRK